MIPPRTLRCGTAAALLTLVITGCSATGKGHSATSGPKAFESRTGAQIGRAALEAMAGVRAVRLKGYVTLSGKKVAFDVRTDGTTRCGGTMRIGHGTATFVATSRAAYLRGDDKFWTEQAGSDAGAVISMLAGRWAKTPPSGDMKALCTLSKGFISRVEDADLNTFEVGKVSRLGSTRVVELTDAAGKGDYRLLVAVDGPHYLRKLVSLTPGDTGEFAFSGFDSQKPVKVPAQRDYVDLR